MPSKPKFKVGDSVAVTFKGTIEWVGKRSVHQVLIRDDGDRMLAALMIPERMLKKEATDAEYACDECAKVFFSVEKLNEHKGDRCRLT